MKFDHTSTSKCAGGTRTCGAETQRDASDWGKMGALGILTQDLTEHRREHNANADSLRAHGQGNTRRPARGHGSESEGTQHQGDAAQHGLGSPCEHTLESTRSTTQTVLWMIRVASRLGTRAAKEASENEPTKNSHTMPVASSRCMSTGAHLGGGRGSGSPKACDKPCCRGRIESRRG